MWHLPPTSKTEWHTPPLIVLMAIALDAQGTGLVAPIDTQTPTAGWQPPFGSTWHPSTA